MSEPKRLFVVDDSVTVRMCATVYLKSAKNLTLEVFADGSPVVAAAKERRPDLVLIDVNMPGMDGPTLMRMLHQALGRSLAVIMMTSLGDAELRDDALRQGAIDFLLKPFNQDQLLALLRKHLPGL
jgi:FixJ family two-component response regulator